MMRRFMSRFGAVLLGAWNERLDFMTRTIDQHFLKIERRLDEQLNSVELDLPDSAYPVTIEAYHPKKKNVVWSIYVIAPSQVSVPPLTRMLNHPIGMRFRYKDGSVDECEDFGMPLVDNAKNEFTADRTRY